jgi:hypothetical protein
VRGNEAIPPEGAVKSFHLQPLTIKRERERRQNKKCYLGGAREESHLETEFLFLNLTIK